MPGSENGIKFGLNEEEASHHVGQMLLFTRACVDHTDDGFIIRVAKDGFPCPVVTPCTSRQDDREELFWGN